MGKNYYLKDRDILDQALEHSWGKSAEAKAKERAYNREYYQRHKEEILRKARQASEGIQRTAQNAYNTVRREAQGIRDAVNPQPRRYSNPKGWTGGRDDTLWGLDKYVDGAHKERIDEARKYRNLAKNTPGAAETERRYRDAMRARSQQAAAVNEALKDGRQLAPDSKFDSKLVRDAQNAYSKVRGKGREAKREFDSAMTKARSNVENAFNNVHDYGEKLKKDFGTSADITSRGLTDRIIEESRSYLNKNGANILKKDPEVVRQLKERGYSDKDIDNYYKYARNSTIARGAARNERAKAARQNSPVERVKRDLRRTTAGARSNVENAFNNARSAVEDAGRYLEKTYKDAQTRSQQRKQAKGYKLMSDLSAIPQRLANRKIPDRNERNEYYRNNPDTRAELNKLGQYRRQYGTAANEAAKASMTRAQKEALKKREEAKRRMQKWFKR